MYCGRHHEVEADFTIFLSQLQCLPIATNPSQYGQEIDPRSAVYRADDSMPKVQGLIRISNANFIYHFGMPRNGVIKSGRDDNRDLSYIILQLTIGRGVAGMILRETGIDWVKSGLIKSDTS